MPLYEFICSDCELTFEELLNNSGEVNLVKCPTCGGRQVKKIISAFATKSSEQRSHAARTPAAACSTGGT